MFNDICHSSAIPDIGGAQLSTLPNLTAVCDSNMALETQLASDGCNYADSVQYTPIESSSSRYNSLAQEYPVFNAAMPKPITNSSVQRNSSLQVDDNSSKLPSDNISRTRSSDQINCGGNSSQDDVTSNFPSCISIDDSLEEDELCLQRDDCFDDIICLNDHSEELSVDYSYSRRSNQETIDLTSPVKQLKYEFDMPVHSHSFSSPDVQPGFKVDCSTELKPPNIFRQQTPSTVFSFDEQDRFNHTEPVSFVGQDMNTLGRFPHKQNNLKKATNVSEYPMKQSSVEGNSSAMRLLSSSRMIGKTPTQKQIKESVIDNSSSKLANPGSMQPTLSRFISSSAVKGKSAYSALSNQLRTPVKSLDIGFGTQSNRKVYLRCNDRDISRLENSDILRNPSMQSRKDPSRLKQLTTETLFSREGSKLHFVRDSVVPSQHFFSPPSKGECINCASV